MLSSERGRKPYAKRKISIEPVYGQIKYGGTIGSREDGEPGRTPSGG